jgi:hypothetical protein
VKGGIYLIQDNGQLIEMTEQEYDSEDLLQELLAKYTNLLAGEQIDSGSPRRFLLISREVSLPSDENSAGRWSVDHLFLDQDAIPTIVEVKRSSDTRLRREVVGQMLDYAANAVVYWPIESIRAQFEANSQAQGLDPEERLSEFLEPDSDSEQFWQKAKTNLQAGKIRMIFIADEIPSELRRIVEFLNSQMDPAEILAVEIKQYVGKGLKTLVPRVMGQTAEAQKKKSSSRGPMIQWDEPSFFKELETRHGIEIAQTAREILEWAKKSVTSVEWGEGINGAFTPVLNHNGKNHKLFSVRGKGIIRIYFLSYKEPFSLEEKKIELLKRLNIIPGASIPPDSIKGKPKIELSLLLDKANLNRFLETFKWVIQEVKAS